MKERKFFPIYFVNIYKLNDVCFPIFFYFKCPNIILFVDII